MSDVSASRLRVLLISWSDRSIDGRLRELEKVAKLIGEVEVITPDHAAFRDAHHGSVLMKYVKFIRLIKNYVRQSEPYNIILADNRMGIIPGYKARKANKQRALLVFDARELYLVKDVHGFKSKLGCFIEKIYMPKADVVVAANAFRASFMQEYYHLDSPVLNFENLRRLSWAEYTEEYFRDTELSIKLKTGKLNMVSTSGCLISRGNAELVKAVKKFEDSIHLFLVGRSPQSDVEQIKGIIESNKIKNVTIINQVDEGTLKFILSRSHIGVVNYHRKDLNNEYCASGKVFEFLFEGMPVVTTENPPLRKLINMYGVGEADDNYVDAISAVLSNYDEYCINVANYINSVSIEENNVKLAKSLIERYWESIQ